MLKIITAIAALAFVASASASPTSTTWTFNNADFDPATDVLVDGTNLNYSSDYQSIAMTNNGIQMTMTAWSDSAPIDTNSSDTDRYDGNVVAADLYYWGSSSGFGVVNNDESTSSPEHGIDNYSAAGAEWSDQDMVLLSFSQSVTLEQINIGWQDTHGNGNNTLDFGVVAISQEKRDAMGSGAAWSDIYSLSDMYKNTTAQANSDSSVDQYYSLDGISGESQHWLVGLYNEMANCDYDSFKLLGVSAQLASGSDSVVDVPEPTSIALFAVGLGLMYRNKKKQSQFKLNV
ncbi:PEP-CTERM sorting domain-containing protein [Psychrosphaera sp.]|nr:PEP-CTERM sorting domain-containing protein [Psychrosphaera sp.]